jgi:hypothetical protein
MMLFNNLARGNDASPDFIEPVAVCDLSRSRVVLLVHTHYVTKKGGVVSDDLKLVPLDEKGFWAFVLEAGGSGLVPTGGFVTEHRIGDLLFVPLDVPIHEGGLQPRLYSPTQISAIIPSTEQKVRAHERPT